MTEWKVLDRRMRSCHGGTAQWVPGERMSVRGKLIPCKNGLHICRDEQDLLTRVGEVICPVVERSDECIKCEDALVCRWVVIGEPNPYWNSRTATHFACDCAEYVLPHAREDQRGLLQAVVDVTRAYADWPEDWADEQDAAWDAAWGAARDAVFPTPMVVESAVASAVESAALSAAVRDAASAAVWAAAKTAPWDDLVAILKTYLDGTSEWVVKDD